MGKSHPGRSMKPSRQPREAIPAAPYCVAATWLEKAKPSVASWQVPQVRAGAKPEWAFAPQQPAGGDYGHIPAIGPWQAGFGSACQAQALGRLPPSCMDFQSCERKRPFRPSVRRHPEPLLQAS